MTTIYIDDNSSEDSGGEEEEDINIYDQEFKRGF
jgi:hypothetical protein